MLPVAVVYEPFPNADGQNSASYATVKGLGSTVKLSFGGSSSTTRPKIGTLTEIKDQAAKLGAQLKQFTSEDTKKVDAKKVDEALARISSGIDFFLGKETKSETLAESTTSEEALAVFDLVADGFGTEENDGGPGIGDLIVYLRDVELVWLADDAGVRLALLDYERVVSRTARSLAQSIDDDPSGLDRETVEALLALDPFVAGGPTAPLREPRFVKVEEYEINGTDLGKTFSREIRQTDAVGTVTTRVKTEEMTQGFLGFLGLPIGTTETKTTRTTITNGSSRTDVGVEKVTVSADLHAGIDEHYALAIFYDRVFGTFAFQEVLLNPEPVLDGVLLDADGKVLAHEAVTVTVGGRTFSTRTSEDGTFACHSPRIGKGEAKLAAVGVVSKFELGPETATVRLQPD